MKPKIPFKKRLRIFYYSYTYKLNFLMSNYGRFVVPTALFCCLCICTAVLIKHEKWEYLGSLFFTAATAALGYQALIYTKEKFRLELFEKRMAEFENVKKFCDLCSHGGLKITEDETDDTVSIENEEGEDLYAAYHKIDEYKLAALFGGDIMLMHHLAYDGLATFMSGNADLLIETANKWPESFMPYIYFGDYKRHYVRPDW